MSEIVEIDSKGRILLKKKFRELLGIKKLPAKVVLTPKDDSIEITPLKDNFETIMNIAKKNSKIGRKRSIKEKNYF